MEHSECNHPEPLRFFAEDEHGHETMMCGKCGVVITLIHVCAKHLTWAHEDADMMCVHVYGDEAAECVPLPDGVEYHLQDAIRVS